MTDMAPPNRPQSHDAASGREKPPQESWKASYFWMRDQRDDSKRMSRAAIRVALRHGATDKEIEAEYAVVKEVERDGK